ncbi:unnamed protein product [Adineta ricciae]|uniref:Ig-like domain-containing protein n=1 Tax=Adineta ricciae TaxID=249248 RepID=A0A815WKU1_ADIRI|nr:unnamed protein product [Adineta ricciae]CAF1629704.1 unnamed protein product [Adineta ricciae]
MFNLSFPRFADFVIFYSFFFFSNFVSITDASTATTTINVVCGTDVELTCPIRSVKKSDEVISWFRPNSSQNHLTFISIGDILLPEYASISRFNLISSPSSISRLLINNVLLEDQGYYKCKSSSTGQHSVELTVNSRPYLSPSSPILLYPVNRTFSITCSLLCEESIELNQLTWLVNGHALSEDRHEFFIETVSFNTQRLTIFLNKKAHQFSQANYTCKYNGKESSIFVRRRTKEELHRLPRQQGSSAAYLLQTAFDTAHTHYHASHQYLLAFFLLLLTILYCAI